MRIPNWYRKHARGIAIAGIPTTVTFGVLGVMLEVIPLLVLAGITFTLGCAAFVMYSLQAETGDVQ